MSPETPSSDVTPTTPRHSKWVLWGWIALVAFCLLANLLTLGRTPPVWIDEARMTDPAWQWAQGNGYTSLAYSVPEGAFYGGYGFLHIVLLGPWLQVFGLSILSVRIFCFLVGMIGAALFLDGVRRWKIVPSPGAFLGLGAMVLLSYGFSFNYRCARTDVTMIACCALGFWFSSLSQRRAQIPGLLVSGMLIVLSGLQAAFFAALLCGFLLIATRGKSLRPALWVGVGCLWAVDLGMAVLMQRDALQSVIRLYTHHLGGGTELKLVRMFDPLYLGVFIRDYSMAGLMLGAVVATALARGRDARRLALFALLYPPAYYLAFSVVYKMPIYYTFMMYFPAATALAGSLGLTWAQRLSWTVRGVLLAGPVLAVMLGVPSRVVTSIAFWDARDYSRVDEWVDRIVEPDDVVIGSYEIFYAVQGEAEKTYWRGFMGNPRGESTVRRKSTLLIIKEEDKEVLPRLRSRWTPVDRLEIELSPSENAWHPGNILLKARLGWSPYNLTAYRKADHIGGDSDGR